MGVLCIAAVLAGPGAALFFELKPDKEECFKWTVEEGEHHIGTYEADGPAEGIVVTMLDPQKKQHWRTTDTSGPVKATASTHGQYSLCFQSTIRENQMVSFDGSWGRDELHAAGVSSKEFVTKNHTDVVKDTVEQMHARILSVLDQQQFTITREAVHRETAERTNTRVIWWTVVEVITLIALAGFQVYYLRSYFEVKTII